MRLEAKLVITLEILHSIYICNIENTSMSGLSDIKSEEQPKVLYLIKHEWRVFGMAFKTVLLNPSCYFVYECQR